MQACWPSSQPLSLGPLATEIVHSKANYWVVHRCTKLHLGWVARMRVHGASHNSQGRALCCVEYALN